MKVSIGTNIKEGPWGGGNLFAINLKRYLISRGHQVVHDLNSKDIDIILITEPRKTSESSAFTHIDVLNYLNFVNNDALVLHRINECDERKGTNFVNKYLIEANKVADYTVFVSTWLKNLYLQQGISEKNKKVILAGADKNIFNAKEKSVWNSNKKLKLVTHHWGANKNKGFDVYEKLDYLIGHTSWKEMIEFTYIGNVPKNFKFKYSNHIEPLSGFELASKIKKHHVYITGSINEPSGNHHIEGAQCGLPVMYLDSGGVAEYCRDFGVKFNIDNIEAKLKFVQNNYTLLSENMNNYPFNSDKMSREFLELFQNMIQNRISYKNQRILPKLSKIDKKIYFLSKYIKKLIPF